eukprot:SAG31_NODE_1080_length_10027_cov_8.417204_9_plen_75_part_00
MCFFHFVEMLQLEASALQHKLDRASLDQLEQEALLRGATADELERAYSFTDPRLTLAALVLRLEHDLKVTILLC